MERLWCAVCCRPSHPACVELCLDGSPPAVRGPAQPAATQIPRTNTGRVARRGAYRPLPVLLRGGRGALEASSGAIAPQRGPAYGRRHAATVAA